MTEKTPVHILEDEAMFHRLLPRFLGRGRFETQVTDDPTAFMDNLHPELGQPISGVQHRLDILLLDGNNAKHPDSGHAIHVVDSLGDRLLTRADLFAEMFIKRDRVLRDGRARRLGLAVLMTGGLKDPLSSKTWEAIRDGRLIGAIEKPFSAQDNIGGILAGLTSHDPETIFTAMQALQKQTQETAKLCDSAIFNQFPEWSEARS